MNRLLTENQKYKNDKEVLKKIFDQYIKEAEWEVIRKEERVKRLYNLANGVIDPADYLEVEDQDNMFSDEGIDMENTGLMFFPLSPIVVDAILGEFDKKYSEYYAMAINPEHTNQILERLTQDLQTKLIQQAETLFLQNNPSPEEMDAFRESETIQEKYRVNYRSTIEMWANHIIKIIQERHRMKFIERQTLKQIVVTEDPVVHVDTITGSLRVENLNEKDCYSRRNLNSECYSEGQMFVWFDYLTLDSLLATYGSILSEKDINKISKWGEQTITDSGFVVNNIRQTGNVQDKYNDSTSNYRNFWRMYGSQERKFDDFHTDVVRVTHMYVQVPRKIGLVRYKGDGIDDTFIVSDEFEITTPPVYDGKKHIDNLVSGEHVEWTWKPELWRVIRFDIHEYKYKLNKDGTNSWDEHEVWAYCDKNPVQFTGDKSQYGTRLPIFGGPTTNFYSDPVSWVERGAPLQIQYNWVMNRNQHLIATEVGKFLLINQNLLPQESFDGSWGKANLLKFALVAHDTSFGVMDPSLNNVGQSQVGLTGGYGQLIDLTKSAEMLEKFQVAMTIKQMFFEMYGLNPANIANVPTPQQNANSVAQGAERTLNQIQSIHTRLDDIMTRVWECVLEAEQHFHSKDPYSTLTYLGDDNARVIFSAPTDDFLVHKLGIKVTSSTQNMDIIQQIKTLAMSNNTMGASPQENIAMLSATNVPELRRKLEDLAADLERKQKEQAQAEHQRNLELEQKRSEASMKEIEAQRARDERLFEQQVVLKQIGMLGYTDATASEAMDQVNKILEFEQKQAELNSTDEYRKLMFEARKAEKEESNLLKERSQADSKDIEYKKLAQKDRELDIREKEVKASNKRTQKL